MPRCLQTRLINVNEGGESALSLTAASLPGDPQHDYDSAKSLNALQNMIDL